MGIIMGALGGLGEAAGQVGSALMKNDLDTERETALATTRSNLATQSAMTLDQFKNTMAINSANQQREAQVQRINTAQQPIIAGAVAGNANKFYGDNSTLTNDDLSDEEKAAFAPTAAQTSDARTQAAIQTGDISPKDAMTNTSKADIATLKNEGMLERASDKNATWAAVTDAKNQTTMAIADLKAQIAEAKANSEKPDLVGMHKLVDTYRDDIKSTQEKIRLAAKLLPDTRPTLNGKPNPAYEELQETLRTGPSEIKEIQNQRDSILQQILGINKKGGPAASPSSPTSGASPYPEGTELTGPGGAAYIVRNGVPVRK